MNAESKCDSLPKAGFCPEDPIEHLYHLASALDSLSDSWDEDMRRQAAENTRKRWTK